MGLNLNCRSFQSLGHCEELQCQVEDDAAEKLVPKIVKILLAEVCPYRVIDRGRGKLRMETSCAHVPMEKHPEFHLDCGYMGRASKDRESWICGFSKGQRLIARDKERENVQRCVNCDKLVNETITSIVQALTVAESDQEVKFEQETSITDVKNTFGG